MLHLIVALTLVSQQTAPSAGDLTRMLNGAPPAAASLPRPAPVAPTGGPAILPSSRVAVTAGSAPSSAATVPTVRTPPPAATARPIPTVPAPSVPATAASTPVPIEPPPPALVVLDSRAVSALPFTASLPTGFSITTGRPGPGFDIYTIRRGGQPFVMVYTGSASQFPIYSGQRVEAGGRTSIVTTEEGRRVALEHLFTRTSAPREIHVWITSLEGADRLLAEQIGQSVDAR